VDPRAEPRRQHRLRRRPARALPPDEGSALPRAGQGDGRQAVGRAVRQPRDHAGMGVAQEGLCS
jgi:hypothetical protein